MNTRPQRQNANNIFHIGDILSTLIEYNLSPNGLGGMSELVTYMCGEGRQNHLNKDGYFEGMMELVVRIEKCKPYLEEQFPQLAALKNFNPGGFKSDHPSIVEWLAEQESRFGKTFVVKTIAECENEKKINNNDNINLSKLSLFHSKDPYLSKAEKAEKYAALLKEYVKDPIKLDTYKRYADVQGYGPILRQVAIFEYLTNDDYDTAIKIAEKVVPISSKAAATIFSAIGLSILNEDFDRAQKLSSRAVELFPDSKPGEMVHDFAQVIEDRKCETKNNR